MLEAIQQIDLALFKFINVNLGNPLFDAILPLCREKWFWMPVYWFLAAFFWVNFGTKKGWIFIIGLVLSVGVADFMSSTIIKKNVQRIRPCNDIALVDQIQERVPCGGGYSFTSSHAANHFAVATFLIGVLGGFARWLRPVALTWAGLIAFSQVYVGVHYPFDVLCGALLGAGIGYVVGWLVGRLLRI